jgi:hypothetical protein
MKLSPAQAKLIHRLVQKSLWYAVGMESRSLRILVREGYAEERSQNIFRPTDKAIAYCQCRASE